MSPAPTQVDLEVLILPNCPLDRPALEKLLLTNLGQMVPLPFWETQPQLKKHVQKVSAFCPDGEQIPLEAAEGNSYRIHMYKLHAGEGEAEFLEDGEGEGSEIHAARHWILPNTEFDGLWESLVYDEDLKGSLLRYARTTLLFADKKVDANLVTWNKVLLLHGPPGTGKTSLCSAFAQKLAIRMGGRYKYGQLIEINSHSLFSKWFSESGKLVQRMFETIQSMVDDPTAIVCVLVDEVESLAAARGSGGGGGEPSDAMRVVNAVLTQLDALRKHPNVLVLTTSNITGTIDLAFVDRADMKKYVGLPSAKAVLGMLSGSLQELRNKGLLKDDLISDGGDANRLMSVAEKCVGFSGRTVRKMPFLAFAEATSEDADFPLSMDAFYVLLDRAVEEQKSDRKKLGAA